MTTEIKVPALGESITEATVANWLKSEGDAVTQDEPLCELETDKVTVEVPAPAAGTLSEIRVKAGGTVEIGTVIGLIAEGAGAAAAPAGAGEKAPPAETKPQAKPDAKPEGKPAAPVSPAVRRIAAESGLDVAAVPGTGRDGRVTKGDALKALSAAPAAKPRDAGPREERVRMTRLRKTIATRLKAAQDTAAMLTTFNEVDMSAVMALRARYREEFETRHGVRLGFMSFFVKACIAALKEIPAVNGEIDGEDIVYRNHYDIGVAVGTERGLVVPVVRDADHLSFAEIEKTVNDFGRRARDNKIALEELQGGTFTISNGGVYGSLMSTPILNAPQSGILGMHKIQDRPVVIDGEIVIRPMMYLALSYDHRLVDGREAVTFLVRVKEHVENPERLILDL